MVRATQIGNSSIISFLVEHSPYRVSTRNHLGPKLFQRCLWRHFGTGCQPRLDSQLIQPAQGMPPWRGIGSRSYPLLRMWLFRLVKSAIIALPLLQACSETSVLARLLARFAKDISLKANATKMPKLSFSYDGLLMNDKNSSIDVPPEIGTTATLESPPGQYPITLSGGSAANYHFKFHDGTLTRLAEGKRTQKINFNQDFSEVRPSDTVALNATAIICL